MVPAIWKKILSAPLLIGIYQGFKELQKFFGLITRDGEAEAGGGGGSLFRIIGRSGGGET